MRVVYTWQCPHCETFNNSSEFYPDEMYDCEFCCESVMGEEALSFYFDVIDADR
jgi:hypothetical protein